MRAGLLAAVFAGLASPAAALSCIQPQIERSFNGWAEADERYYIGVGTLTPAEPLPQVPQGFDPLNPNFERDPVAATYSFSGRLLDGQAGVAFDMPITVKVSCVASWCGRFPEPGTSGLMALRGDGILNLTLEMHACPGSIFPAETEATVSQCILDGRCAEQ